MFIRTKKTPRRESISVQWVESFREQGKIKQRVMRHVGTAPTEEKLKELLRPPVLLALFVTDKGLAVGYELFPGATFEGPTLITALEKLKLRYNLEDAVFVADVVNSILIRGLSTGAY